MKKMICKNCGGVNDVTACAGKWECEYCGSTMELDENGKILMCEECGKTFVFTAVEQAFYAEHGFHNSPRRCKTCRAAHRNTAHAACTFFTATCAGCGGKADVPFEPIPGRPVYCSECYARLRAGG